VPSPLSLTALRRALAAAGLDAPARYEERTRSTNATALELAEAGTPEWTVVAAGHQTAGRGRLGRTWLDEPGRSLLFSVVLRPPIPPERAGLITLLAGACAAGAASEVAGTAVRCKWPNDLLLGEAKVGGILAEARVEGTELRHVVVGVGVNVSDPPEGVREATGLGGVEQEALLTGILHRLAATYHPRAPGFAEEVLGAWRSVASTLGRRVRAATTVGRDVEGTAVDVDPTGALLVRTAAGTLPVAFGEVVHLRP
jgi:BirA family transcriptional regulator, biotin operon repressor / biotin---[acetyl-CoA-carboxylase] ligase